MTRVQTILYPGNFKQTPTLANLVQTYHSTRAQEVLKEVDAMRQYQVSLHMIILDHIDWLPEYWPRFFNNSNILQEDVENLNEVAHNRPRAQLVLGIQQENRYHIKLLVF